MDNITATNMLKMRNMGVNLPDEVYETAVIGLEELEQYRSIGTVSECREAVKKQRAKKPIIKPWCPAICPMCGEELSESLGDGYYKHLKGLKVCPKCFQRLDWSDTL